MAIARSCNVCGARTPDGSSRCPTHKGGAGRPRSCITCGVITTRGNYCPDHDPVTNAAAREARQPYRAGYRDPAYYREAQAAKRRDRYTCTVPGCGRGKTTGDKIHADHVISLRDGMAAGIPLEQLNHRDNLVTLCEPHHQIKTNADRQRRREQG